MDYLCRKNKLDDLTSANRHMYDDYKIYDMITNAKLKHNCDHVDIPTTIWDEDKKILEEKGYKINVYKTTHPSAIGKFCIITRISWPMQLLASKDANEVSELEFIHV